MKSKTKKLAEAVRTFKDSEQKPFDYMQLFMVVKSVLKQGSGLLWSDVNEVLQEELK